MKIKNIAAICKKNKAIVLFEKHSESGDTVIKYIGDGGAAYPVAGLPPLDTESVLTIFDVPEKDRDKYIVRTMGIPEGINFEDTDADEKPIEGAALSIVYPFWREEAETREDIATWIGGFEFPVPDGLELAEGWEIGYRQPSLIVNVFNSGDVKSGIRIEFRALGVVKNPVLLNVDTQEFIKLNISLVAGDVLTVSTGYGEKAVKLKRGGVTTDAFRYLDVDSSYLQIAVGDNLFRYSADTNAENLEVSIYHNNLYLGV